MQLYEHAKKIWNRCMILALIQIRQNQGHAHVENPVRSQAWNLDQYTTRDFLIHSHRIRRDGCMDGFKNTNGDTVLKPSRIQSTDPTAVTAWTQICNHKQRHPQLEGAENLARSARYTAQMCAVITKHILSRPANVVQFAQDTALQFSKEDSYETPLMCQPCETEEDFFSVDGTTTSNIQSGYSGQSG